MPTPEKNQSLKVGDIVEWEGKNGEKVLVEVTDFYLDLLNKK